MAQEKAYNPSSSPSITVWIINRLIKTARQGWAMCGAHIYNPIPRMQSQEDTKNSRLFWSIEHIPEQPGWHSERPCLNKQTKNSSKVRGIVGARPWVQWHEHQKGRGRKKKVKEHYLTSKGADPPSLLNPFIQEMYKSTINLPSVGSHSTSGTWEGRQAQT